MHYKSTKLFSGYSTCFRQARAIDTHCRYLHGYSLKFKVVFIGSLDDRNWVVDFGCFKKNGVKEYLDYMFDHTTVIAESDPCLDDFKLLDKKGIIQLRIIPEVSCEKFAEHIFNYLNLKMKDKIFSVECIENERNSAIYGKKD